ncbi:HlyD family type I secretion periplasmic adaptor subunit [Aestuariispira insulae]|nr:HlyD family type I secretion periplasmic adaptor subunit [Aestuariispira insulae]
MAGDSIAAAIRRPFILGLIVIIGFVGGLSAWSALAPLTGAVIAKGKISSEGATRTVQHLEGGIIDRILVREGQKVRAGEIVMTLQDIQARSAYDELLSVLQTLEVRKKRLLVEQAGKRDWSPDLLQNIHDIDRKHRRTLLNEVKLFQSRVKSWQQEGEIYASRIQQLKHVIDGLMEQNIELQQQQSLLEGEIADVQSLVDKGLERRPRILGLKRLLHQLREKQAFNRGRIAETREQVSDFELRRLNSYSRRQEEIDAEISDVQNQITQLREKLGAAKDILERTMLRAPVSGTVANVQINTTGGVLSPGADVLDIVPEGEPIVIQARVSPTDIDDVRPHQPAFVHLSAYSFRYTDPLPGKVLTVSADLIEEKETQQAFYTARIMIAEESLADLPTDVKLTSGMPTEVFIATEARTILTYLFQPMLEYVNRAFRES